MEDRRKSPVSGEQVMEALAGIAFDEAEVKPSERMKALELIGKHIGLWKEAPPEDAAAEELSNLAELIEQRRDRGAEP